MEQLLTFIAASNSSSRTHEGFLGPGLAPVRGEVWGEVSPS